MKKNDALKKHHFWILAGLAPLFTLLAVIMLVSGVGGAAGEAVAAQDAKLAEIQGVSPIGTKASADLEQQKTQLLAQREKLWKTNWEGQKPFFIWPGNDPLLKQMEARYTRFGEPMVANNSEFERFRAKSVYEAAYEQMAKSIAPTQFRGGSWQAVLRHVSNWGNRVPTSNQIWLALEDIWVQRGLLQPIATVNDNISRFDPIGDQKDKLNRSFRSRIWDLNLEIGTTSEGPKKQIIKAKLTNRTDRLQLLGIGNQMKLLIKLSKNSPPVLYRIEGEFVKAGDTLVAKENPRLHAIPLGTEVQEIVSVRLLLDTKTSPIRRLESVDLGYKDARHFASALNYPSFIPPPAAPVAGGFGSGSEGGSPESFGGDPAGGDPMGAMVPMGPMGPGGAGARATMGAKRGGPEAVLDANAKRYVTETDQVRRMPVCLVLLVDQLFVQDALAAYTNSPLRFQITQFHWKRYRGGQGGGSGSLMGEGGSSGFGSPGGFGGGAEMMLPEGGGADGGAAFIDPLAGEAGGGGFGEGGLSPMEGGFVLPTAGADSYSPFGQRPASSLTEGQDTSGLVELTIYGIVTLYKNYDTKDDPKEEAAPMTDPSASTESGT